MYPAYVSKYNSNHSTSYSFNDFQRENYLVIKKLSAFLRGIHQKIMTIFIV